MRPRQSLRLRLILASLFGVVVAMLIAGLFIADLYRAHTTDRFQSELDHHLDELVAMTVAPPHGGVRVAQPLSDPLFNVPRSGLYWQVAGADGTLLRSRSLGEARLTPAADGGWHAGRAGSEAVLQRSIWRGGTVTTIASARALLDEQISHFHGDLALSMAAVGALLLGGAALLVGFGLAPVRRLSAEVDRLHHGEIPRLSTDVPAEFAPTVTRLNALLDGQAQLIARARTEAGNLAHNLRTPLALIADEAEQLRLRGATEAGDFLLARCEVMRRQIDHHLARAAAAGTRGAGTLTLVAPLVGQIVDAMRRLHAARDLRFVVTVPPDLRLRFEQGDLAEILSNLIDNACKWARSTVVIEITAHTIEIRDDGPGIEPDQREAALIVGKRLDPETPGSGLGLAAVTGLLRIYDGRVSMGTAAEGGLAVTIGL